MKEHSIKIEKTAHYYSIGELNKQTNELWIVCHGYGQLASFFIDKFKELNKDNRYIVAPEGLNKFYLHGFDGRVEQIDDKKKDLMKSMIIVYLLNKLIQLKRKQTLNVKL